MKRCIKIPLILSVLSVLGCSKYLDYKPDKKLVVPSTYIDAQALLDNTYDINMSTPLSIQIGADDHYFTAKDWLTANNTDRNSYVWGDDIFNDNNYNDWTLPYMSVYYSNVVLDALAEGKITGSKEQLNNIKGQSLFIRSFAFYNLLQVFAKPYFVDGTNAEEPGIPLRTVSDHNVKTVRSNLKISYEKVINDLKEAVELLPNRANVVTRASKLASYALLSRIYLGMEDYHSSRVYASYVLDNFDALLDYNQIKEKASYSFDMFNIEVLFHSHSATRSIMMPPTCKIDTNLYESYEDSDLRKKLFFRQNNDGSFSFIGSYDGSQSLFTGLAVDEIYLNKIECLAREGEKESAIMELNIFLANRYSKDSFIPLTTSNEKDVLDVILLERRKQLIFRSTRWSDLRRLNNDPKRSVTIKRVLDGEEHSLLPNDKRYIYPIPLNVIAISELEQNIRN